jgi:hypothetical protein
LAWIGKLVNDEYDDDVNGNYNHDDGDDDENDVPKSENSLIPSRHAPSLTM